MIMSKTSTRKKELQRKVLYSLLAASVMSVCISGGDVWAANVNYGKAGETGGLRVIYVPLPDGVTVNNNNDAGTTTINGGSLTIDYDGQYSDVGAVQARADKEMAVYPELSITMQDALTVNSKFTAVTGQDGKVNLTSNNGDVIVSTSFTSKANLKTGTTAATHLSNEAYAAVYARNLFAKDGVAGEVNISGKNVHVLTAKETMTGAGMETVKYGTAISGNGNGAINIHATDTVVINGAIESLNTYLQKKGTTGIKVNINQDAADTAKVTMEGLFINAADESEVNIKGAAGSSIKADLLASATPALMGSGGLINIDFADGGTVEGAITAQNSGVIKITGADITGSVTVDGGEYHGTDTSVTSSTDNLGTYADTEKGAVIIKNNGKAVFGGTQTKITVDADHDGKVYGVVLDAGEAEFNADTTITVVNVTKTGPEAGKAYAVWSTEADSEISLLGNTSIEAAGVEASYALYAENGGKITVGSEGKTVSLTGDVVAENSGKITLAGDINTVAGIVTADGGEVVLGGSEKATYTANKFVTANSGKIIVSGGTLNIDNLTNKFALLDDSLEVTGNGVLKATSDNLFDKDNNVAIKDDVDKVVLFTGGKLAVSDATYTLADSTSYSKALKDNGAKTTIVMTGNLTDTNVTNEANVEVLAPTGAVHINVTGEVSGKILNVCGSASTDSQVSNVDNDLGVKDLQFKADEGATINITDNKKLTLVGAGSGELLQGTTGSNNIVNVGDTDNGTGTLTLGDMAAANSGGTLNADVNLQAGSKMNVETGNFTVQKIAAKEGTLAVNAGASLQTEELSIGDSSKGTVEAAGSLNVDELKINKGSIAVTGSLNAGKLLAVENSDAAITVGDAESAGTLTAARVALNGASLMLDPVWKDNSTISTASKAGLEFANSHTVDGKLTVGQNSVLSLGTTDTAKAEAAFAATGLTWGQNDITAALYIDAAQTLDSTKGGITVDGSLTHDSKSGMAEANTAHFANQSLLMVDSSLLSNDVALKATNGTLTVDTGAKLYIANAEADKNYIVVSGFGNGNAVYGWGADGLLLNKLVKVDAENTNFESGKYTVATKKVSASEALPSVALPNILDAMKSDTDSAFAGVKYLSNAISDLNSDAQATAAVNGFAQGAENSGAAHSGTMAAFTIGDTIQSRMSLANDAAPQGGKVADADDNGSIWAQYIHNKDKVDNLGGISYDGQYNGVIIGGDFVPTGKYHSGVAFSYGSGSSTGSVSKNDFDFWGLSYYGSIKNDDTNVIFDAGYSKTSNDIKGAVAIDSDTKVLTLGVKGEKLINNGHGTSYVPYAGLRYLNVDGGSYNGTIGGKVAAHYSNDKANIWMLPIGIGVHHETVTADGWKVRPMADIAYVWTFGDNNSAMDVTVPGVNAMDRLGYDIMDSGFFVGKLGLEAEKGDWTYGLGYAYQKGSHAQNNKFMVNITYSF